MKYLEKQKYNPEEYEYVGPEEIFKMVNEEYKGTVINNPEEILNWIVQNIGKPKKDDLIVCTFIINLKSELVIGDRHSEHVQCANGENVKSAGEIGFQIDKSKVHIGSITNQSTGYCPSSASWSEVEKALKKIDGINIPEGFDSEFIFSYCPNCKTRQIVKDEFYFCPKCEQRLLSENEFQTKRKKLVFK
ncbi:MAG: hypothetical protein ACPGVB_08365 [Chitinophagales bacterium]